MTLLLKKKKKGWCPVQYKPIIFLSRDTSTSVTSNEFVTS